MSNKYGATKTTIDGITFDSKKEADRYLYLKSANVKDLQMQVPFLLVVNNVKVCKYIADFVYVKSGFVVVEDVKGLRKGPAWNMFRLKAKLMEACHGIEVQVV